MEKIRLGISSCLLGEHVRYDGGHKLDHFLKDTLGRHVEWVAVCPEVEYGLSVPREAMHLVKTERGPRLVTSRTGVDHTDGMKRWAVQRLRDWPETRAIPVIGLSAAALPRDTARAKEIGFYRYLTKPVKVDELTAALEELLRPAPRG